MHMADALLSPAVGGAMLAASAGAAIYSAKKIRNSGDEGNIPLMGVMGAFVFAAQMINFAIPGTGSSGHLGGGLLLAILLGPFRGFLTLASVLLIQALFFADGGLLAFGCNLFNLGFYACFIAYPLIYKPLARNNGGGRALVASLAGAVIGLQLGAFSVVLETMASGMTSLTFGAFALLMQPIHLAIGLVEGVATAAVVAFVWKTRPDLLHASGTAINRFPVSRAAVLAALAAGALTIGGALAWFASPKPDGLEWALEKAGAEEGQTTSESVHEALASLQARTAILPDYGFKETDEQTETEIGPGNAAWPAVSAGTSLSGIIGGLSTLALAGLIGYALSRFGKKCAP